MHRRSAAARLPRLLVAASLLGVPASALAQIELDDQIIREGTGERREQLTALELTQFAPETWDLLSDWNLASEEDEQPSPDTLDGKVVLIMTFASWYPPSMRSLGVVGRMAQERAEDGLVVIGVHDTEAYEDGVGLARDRGALFPIARDADNAFREAMLVDQDPDFFLIDRSGQLRFADFETASLEAAVDLLLAESREDAETLVSRIADARRRAEIEARRTARINQQADLTNIPEVPFVMPTPEQYALVRWPQFPRDPNQPQFTNDQQAPRKITMPRDGFWPAAPAGLGRASVVYFFDRRVPESTALIPQMEAIQLRHKRDLYVIGALTPLRQDNTGQQPTTPAVDPLQVVRQAYERAGLTHVLVADPGGALLGSASGNTSGFGGFSGSTQGPPVWAAVVSSDGTVRWFGNPNTPAFESAVQVVAREDPGVRARRQAEDEYLRTRNR